MMRALLGYDERRYSFKSIEDYLDEIVKKKLGINRPLTFREITIFEAWCIGRDMNIAYDEQFGKEFYLDREKNEDSSYDRLKQLIGLSIVKKQIESIIASDVIEKERKKRKGKKYFKKRCFCRVWRNGLRWNRMCT